MGIANMELNTIINQAITMNINFKIANYVRNKSK